MNQAALRLPRADDTAERIAKTLVTDMRVIASPPEVYLKFCQLADDERTPLEALGDVIQRDPGLAARVLRLVNTPWFGLRFRVDTISRAVGVLGLAEVRKLVTATTAVTTFSRLSSRVTNMTSFWRHGVYAAFIAQALARALDVLHPERLFVAGVLHDLGTLLLNHRYPETAAALILDTRGDEQALRELEMDTLGFDHALLGSLMLAHWQLPATTTEAVCWHHEPTLADVGRLEAEILHAADRLANASSAGRFSELPGRSDLPTGVLDALPLPAGFDLDALLERADRDYAETVFLFLA